MAANGDRCRVEETAFAVVRKHDEQFLGVVGLPFADEEVAELGFWLGRPYWSKGYMTEAVRRVLAYAFTQRAVATVRAAPSLATRRPPEYRRRSACV